jgi:hypothetical protein
VREGSIIDWTVRPLFFMDREEFSNFPENSRVREVRCVICVFADPLGAKITPRVPLAVDGG